MVACCRQLAPLPRQCELHCEACLNASHDHIMIVNGSPSPPLSFSKTKRGVNALMKCASAGATDMVKQLLLAGADVNKVANPGWTALQLAASSKHIDVVQVLLWAGADTEIADAAGLSPIFIATQKGSLPMIKLLTETAGASIAGTDQHGLNLLGHAAELGKSLIE